MFLKPFPPRCCFMVIGLQSAPVTALIWVKDHPVSWQTANRILPLGASEVFWVYHLTFSFHNLQNLLRNSKWLSYCIQPQQQWHVARSLAYAAQQSDCSTSESFFFAFAIRRSWQSKCLTDNDIEFTFLRRFWHFKAVVLNFWSIFSLNVVCNRLLT